MTITFSPSFMSAIRVILKALILLFTAILSALDVAD